MRKFIFCFILLAGCAGTAAAQKNDVDSLTKAYKKNRQDTTLVQLLYNKAQYVFVTNPDSCISCLRQSLAISRKIHYQRGEVGALEGISTYLVRRGALPQSLKITFDVLPKAIAINDQRVVANCYNTLGLDYALLKDYKKALSYFFLSKAISEKERLADFEQSACNNIARQYLDMGMADSAEYYTKKGYLLDKNSRIAGSLIRNFGIVQVLRKNYANGIDYFRKSIQYVPKLDNHYLLSEDYRRMAEVYQKLSRADSSLYFATKAFDEANLDKNPTLVMKSSGLLTDLYRLNNDYKNV